MRQVLAVLFSFCTLFSYTESAFADPWFTGPILAPAGRTMPNGHTNLEIYGFYSLNTGFYNNHWKKVHDLTSNSSVLNPIFTHGIADKIDVQFSLPYVYNGFQGLHKAEMGDTAVALGYQLLEQKKSKWRPNLRFTVQEIIPSGSFTQLDPANNGTDASGLGSYQTAFTLNFQHLAQISEVNYFRTRLSLNYVYARTAHINGLSSYGGTEMTFGDIKPGNMVSADLAAELTLTQNWVAVMETYLARRQATHFRGFIGVDSDGFPGSIGHDTVDLISLAPAIEYNFTPTIGLIAGPWFSVAGRNSAHFITYVLALNAYW